MLPFSRLLTLATLLAALLFGAGVMVYVYCQGGVDKAIYLNGE
jgi:glycerol uptake facilitator-like aquaporin